jgi:DNA-binding NarL/FixJ family response regulator
MTRVLIADDHTVVRRGLRQILEEQPDIQVAGEAENAEEIFAYLAKDIPDLLVLDINMPGKSGLETLMEIKQMHPKLPVLILTMHPEEQFARRFLIAGASGYVTKETAPDEFVRAIRTVINGRKYISSTLSQRLLESLGSTKELLPHEKLSAREFQVLLLIASGKTASEIAVSLSLSVKTISTFRRRILEKMGLRTNSQLTVYVFNHQLLPTS